MESRFVWTQRGTSRIVFCLAACFAFTSYATGQQLQQARVTQVVNDVKLLPNQAAPLQQPDVVMPPIAVDGSLPQPPIPEPLLTPGGHAGSVDNRATALLTRASASCT